ncbi:hypothetical protein JAAARDRAFT_411050 [Jaapia argillacea MUCL 33604]|uniref:Uncharacterized protein n=1 Tax=Jaapia argillacea MUCL 33604 TaxID=933084 RepID=A0A067PH23_9AGAM|nr:hypothetical protein JAAARDRAFT_411050 [Jaapia argillacea MUCL 33604]
MKSLGEVGSNDYHIVIALHQCWACFYFAISLSPFQMVLVSCVRDRPGVYQQYGRRLIVAVRKHPNENDNACPVVQPPSPPMMARCNGSRRCVHRL